MTYEQLCLQIKKYDLHVPGDFYYHLAGMIELAYNGCGAEWMPEFTRKALSWLYRHYDAAVHIHDLRFEYADGSRGSLQTVNDEFYMNCLKIWRKRFGIFRFINPYALWELKKIKTAYRFLQLFSGKAWHEAYDKNNQWNEGVYQNEK